MKTGGRRDRAKVVLTVSRYGYYTLYSVGPSGTVKPTITENAETILRTLSGGLGLDEACARELLNLAEANRGKHFVVSTAKDEIWKAGVSVPTWMEKPVGEREVAKTDSKT